MRILTQAGARYFCQSFGASANYKEFEVDKLLRAINSARPFKEGAANYANLRDCLLRDAERFAFLGASNYASALRHLNAASAAWAVVGFYYSAFFAARSLVAMHGGWIDGDKSWLEVTGATPGGIEITHRKTRHHALPRNHNSHRAFWTIFYNACSALQLYADPNHSYALAPVQNSATWLSDNRNKVNYGSANALNLTAEFINRFDPVDVASSFPGDIKVFRNIAQSMLANVASFRASNGLATDLAIGGAADLTAAIGTLIKTNRPNELDAYAIATIGAIAA